MRRGNQLSGKDGKSPSRNRFAADKVNEGNTASSDGDVISKLDKSRTKFGAGAIKKRVETERLTAAGYKGPEYAIRIEEPKVWK